METFAMWKSGIIRGIGGRGLLLCVMSVITLALMGMKSADDIDFDRWLEEEDLIVAKALAVNEGDLEFLNSPPSQAPHLLENKLTILESSLKDGWVDLVQCHENLDAVLAAQILYRKSQTRELTVLSSKNIGAAWVEGNSVQLENIDRNAQVCVKAQVKALHSNYDGTYSMRNGPFLRKFLDGYYPMHVTMDVRLPYDYLQYEDIQPQEQAGLKVFSTIDGMFIDALFVGELTIEVYLREQETAIN